MDYTNCIFSGIFVINENQKGQQTGLEGKLEDAEKMLRRGFPLNDIIEITQMA